MAPNLHTHAIVMNMTKDKEGNWKAIESQDIFKNYMASGMTYRSIMSDALQKAGFEIKVTDVNKGFYELASVPQETNEVMSPRSMQIAEKVKELRKEFPNMPIGELKQIAAHKSRSWKGKIDRAEMRTQNVAIMEALGLDTNALLSRENMQHQKKELSEEELQELMHNAIKATTDEKAVFKKEDIETTVYKFALKDGVSIEEVEKAYQEAMQSKDKNKLLYLGKNHWTTKEFVQIERFLVNFTENTQGAIEAPKTKAGAKIHTKKYSDELKEKTGYGMTKGQKESAELIMSAKDQIIGIQGDAGTGKTTMLKAVNAILGSEDLIGLSYTGKAASEIERATASKDMYEEAGIKSMTIAKFLHAAKKMPKDEKEKYQGKKLIVDEASMLSTRDAQKLFNFAKESGSQLVLMGDTKQFSAINAGSPFRLLQENGMQTAKMEEVLRQKNETLKEAVSYLNNPTKERNERALETLKKAGMIKEIGTYEIDGEKITDKELFREEAINEMVELYFQNGAKADMVVSSKDTFSQLILTNTNDIKDELNSRIREQAKEKGMIDSQGKQYSVLEPVRLSPTKKYFSENYEKDQIVEIDGAIKGMGHYERGSVKIANTDPKNDSVTLSFKQYDAVEDAFVDKTHEVNLSKEGFKLTTFEEKEREFAKGDKIVFEKNENSKYHVKNGETGIITAQEGDMLTIKKEDGSEVEIDTNEYKYLNHGYAVTTHKSQGQTSDKVYAFMDSSMQDFKSLYVTVTRAVHDLKIWTDDYEMLKTKTSKENEKENAIEDKTKEEIESLLGEGKLEEVRELIDNDESKADAIEKVVEKHNEEKFYEIEEPLRGKEEEKDPFLERMESFLGASKQEPALTREELNALFEKINRMIPGQTSEQEEAQKDTCRER
ncbi:MAG: AAA family ATPase [Campylobacterales bacterium]|nr:AAA family ATPase [Campylobacterales bacterium]